jgi:hypothetical protein
MDDKKPYAEYNGVKIFSLSLSSKPIDTTVSFGNTRIVFHGKIGIDRTEGSYRWGKQVLIATWMDTLPEINNRCEQKGYSRIQIALPRDEAIKLLRKALEELEKEEPKQIQLG